MLRFSDYAQPILHSGFDIVVDGTFRRGSDPQEVLQHLSGRELQIILSTQNPGPWSAHSHSPLTLALR